MNPEDWQAGDIVRRKTPYRHGNSNAEHGELCRIKKVWAPMHGDAESVIVVVGNRTTGSLVSRIEKHYEWVSRGAPV